MFGNFANWFNSGDFMPHGNCILWTPSLLWIDVTSDLITAISYLSIPFALWYFARKRPDIPFRWVFLMFGVFVLACGSTHLFAAWNIWHADYWPEAAAKALTAGASAATAILLWPLLPKALAIPSQQQLEQANRQLRDEIRHRQNAENALHATNESLERRVAERTVELERTANSLRESEARFRSLTAMSSDFYWESDAEHRLTHRGAADKSSAGSVFRQPTPIGKCRWDIPSLSPDASGWVTHRTVLEAHEPFRDFEFSRLDIDGAERFIAISGDPTFDALGAFTGYRGVGTDITRRKKSEEGLKLFRALIDQSNDAIEVVDPDTFRFLDVNQKACLDLGYSREEMLALTAFDVDPAFERSAAMEAVQGLKQSGSGVLEGCHRRKDGSEFPVEISLKYVRLDRAYVLAIVRDITDRKHAEHEMKRDQEALRRFRVAMDATQDAIYLVDRATMQFIDVNAAACRIRGQTRERILALGPERVLVQSQEELEKAYDAVIASGGKSTLSEAQGQRMDGSQFTVELARSAHRTEQGWIIVTVARDITERKQAAERIRASEARLRRAEFISKSGNWELDLDSKVIRSSEGAAKVYGVDNTEWDYAAIKDIPLPEYRQTLDTALRNLIELGEPYNLEFKIRTAHTGEIKDIHSIATYDKEKKTLFGVIRDVTERKLAEARIQRLTQLYAALSQCNEAIVRSSSEEELFPQICRAAVQLGGMKLAWIATVVEDARTVRVAASAGDHADEYLKDIEISLDPDSLFGLGPTGTAIRENRPIWNQDLEQNPLAKPWQERRARFDLRSGGSLPLHRHGVPAGALNLYAGEAGAFDEAARQLLAEMATDIDFALENFARETTRARAEHDLRAAEEKYRGLVEQSVAGVYIVQDGKFAYVNPRAVEIIGHGTADDVVGADPLQWVAEADRDRVAQNMRRVIEGEVQGVAMDFAAVRADGTTVQIGGNAARATHQGRPAIIGLMQDVSEKKRADEQIQQYMWELKTAFMSTVEVATTLSEMRDPYTAGHEHRVGKIAAAIGTELGLDEQRIEGLRVAGFLHDIGKINIPAEILSKPGRLSGIEYRLIKGHPQSGYDVLKDVKFPWPVAEVALQHHERMDGSGYPQGLKGEAILLEARIMAVADVMEAMSSHRPYRPGLGIDSALAEIERGRSSAYDPGVVDACLRLFRERRYQLPT